MAVVTLFLVVVVFLAAVALVFVVAKALRSWVFELTPIQWMVTEILTFSLGALLVAFLVGDGELELLASLPIVIALAWWLISAISAAMSNSAPEPDTR